MGDKDDKDKKKMLHTTHSELTELGNGQFQQVISGRRIARWSKVTGSLRRHVNTWDFTTGDYPFTVLDSSLAVLATASGDRRFLPDPDDLKTWLEFEAPYTKPALNWQKQGIGTIGAVSADLNAVGPNLKSRIVHAGHYCKAEYELLNGYRPTQIAFPYALNGLTRKDDTFLDSKGNVVCLLRTPTAYDRSTPEKTVAIPYSWGKIDGKEALIFTPPDLRGMARPVLDPTLVLQPAAADGLDTYMQEGTPTTNYGTVDHFYAQRWALYQILRSPIKFDLSTLVGATITDAALTLTARGAGTRAAASIYAVLVANIGWTEMGATWNTRDGTNPWAGSKACGTAGIDYNAIAIGSYAAGTTSPLAIPLSVSAMQAMVSSNAGMLLRADNETVDNTVLTWCSSDHPTPASRPMATFVYTLPSGRQFFMRGVERGIMRGAR